MPATSLPVEHLFSIMAELGSAITIENGPAGTRHIVNVTGGSFEGPRLRGKIADSPAGDWVTARPDGSVRLDVRVTLLTDDGAPILMTYSGIGAVKDGSFAIRSAPQFETGDPRYTWLNNVQAVGVGVRGRGTVTYEIYALL